MSKENFFSQKVDSQPTTQGEFQYLSHYSSQYESLEQFALNFDFISLIQQICSCINRNIPLDELNENRDFLFSFLINIEYLRKLRKFQTKLFEKIMNRIVLRLGEKLDFVTNKKIKINSMLLINETFSGLEIKSANKWVEYLLLALVKYKLDEDVEISLLADAVLKSFVQKNFFIQTVETLFNSLFASGTDGFEVCSGLLNEFIKNIPANKLAWLSFDFLEDTFKYNQITGESQVILLISNFLKDIRNKLTNSNENLFSEFMENLGDKSKKIFCEIINLNDFS